MQLSVTSFNHRKIPLKLREKLAFNADEVAVALPALKEKLSVQGLVLLSTCNRTEIYTSQLKSSPPVIGTALQDYKKTKIHNLEQLSEIHCGINNTSKHALRLACGLDSMMLGETQILGQIKRAYNSALEQQTADNNLAQVFEYVLAQAKKIRNHSGINQHATSIAQAGVKMARKIFGELNNLTTLVVGAGENTEQVIENLQSYGVSKLLIANRDQPKAHKLAAKYSAEVITLDQIADNLKLVDVVISSTGSTEPLITKATVVAAINQRKHRPICMVDLAVPRDISPQVGELADVYLYTLDDLQNLVNLNQHKSLQAAQQAEKLINKSVFNFIKTINERRQASTVRDYLKQVEQIRTRSLQQSLRMLNKGDDPREVLSWMAHRLSKSISHIPVKALRQLNPSDTQHLKQAIRQALDDTRTKT